MAEIGKPSWTALLAIVVAMTAVSEVAAIQIDDFNVNQQVDATTILGSMSSAPDGLGGERDMRVFPAPLSPSLGTIAADTNVTAPSVFTVDLMPLGPPLLAELEYDGFDGTPLVDPTGLGGVDLTVGGTHDRFELDFLSTNAGAGVVITVHTDADHRSNFGITVPAGISSSTLLHAEYSDFVMVTGSVGPADFSNVGAIELVFLAAPPGNLTLQLASIQTAPMPPAVPTLGEWGIVLLVLALAAAISLSVHKMKLNEPA